METDLYTTRFYSAVFLTATAVVALSGWFKGVYIITGKTTSLIVINNQMIKRPAISGGYFFNVSQNPACKTLYL